MVVFHDPEADFVGMTREGSSVFVDTVQYPTILDTHTGRFTKRSALSPCTARGSRLPGLTRQGGKHTLQRPKGPGPGPG